MQPDTYVLNCCFCCVAGRAAQNHNMMLLDEPTNHLDIEAIDSLAEAIKGFKVSPGWHCHVLVFLCYALLLIWFKHACPLSCLGQGQRSPQ